MRWGSVAAVALALFGVVGCDARTPRTAMPSAPVATETPREAAARLAARGDYAAAEAQYRAALQREPDDVELHFGLASVLSQLDRRDAAIEEFRWVVSNGRPGRPEVDSARRWLAEAGVGAPAAPSAGPADVTATGRVAGTITWPGLPPGTHFGVRLVLERADGGSPRNVRSQLNGDYVIDGVADGSYTLTGLAGPTRLWSNVPVAVSGGEATRLDLTPANAAVSTSEFPVRSAAK